MNAETLLQALLRVNLVASAAIVLVLVLRPFVLKWSGARIAWWLWLVVPIAAAASFVPAPERIVLVPPAVRIVAADDRVVEEMAITTTQESVQPTPVVRTIALPTRASALVALWLLVATTLIVRSIINTRRAAANPALGPALVGVLRPRLVLPRDFATRFDAREQALILAHEEVHRVSGHTLVNGLAELARCLNWFNPLVHLAVNKLRTDQELACDAAVIAAHPTARHAYAEALLKTQVSPAFLPLGCTWTSRSGERLAQRIEMLGRPSLSRRGAIAGSITIAVAGLVFAYAAWAQQSEQVVTQVLPQPPAGSDMTPLEGTRHDRNLLRAQQGDIDLVFFGTTNTEMWYWPDRGRPVWDRTLGLEKAANFGSQGTHPESLLWRMQHGELDGYQAKLIVLSAFGLVDNPVAADRRTELVASYVPVLAEIRARQPQAKVLILADFPRGFGTVEQWRATARTNAETLAELIDNDTVFYADIGERFFKPDGSHNTQMWARQGINGIGVGMQPAGFEAWAEEMQPWLDRFVR